MSWQYWLLVESLIVGGSLMFVMLSYFGRKLMTGNGEQRQVSNLLISVFGQKVFGISEKISQKLQT
jgi:hypothetical protein